MFFLSFFFFCTIPQTSPSCTLRESLYVTHHKAFNTLSWTCPWSFLSSPYTATASGPSFIMLIILLEYLYHCPLDSEIYQRYISSPKLNKDRPFIKAFDGPSLPAGQKWGFSAQCPSQPGICPFTGHHPCWYIPMDMVSAKHRSASHLSVFSCQCIPILNSMDKFFCVVTLISLLQSCDFLINVRISETGIEPCFQVDHWDGLEYIECSVSDPPLDDIFNPVQWITWFK